jgi:hypothetical protein
MCNWRFGQNILPSVDITEGHCRRFGGTYFILLKRVRRTYIVDVSEERTAFSRYYGGLDCRRFGEYIAFFWRYYEGPTLPTFRTNILPSSGDIKDDQHCRRFGQHTAFFWRYYEGTTLPTFRRNASLNVRDGRVSVLHKHWLLVCVVNQNSVV